MAKKLDLNKLKDEIHKEKQNRNIIPSQLGENVSTSAAPRDVFLNGLISSLHSGQETPASTLIKVVENKVAEKHGMVKRHIVNETAVTPTPQATPIIDTSPDRDEQLYRDLEVKRKQTLAESISNFQNKAPATETPPTVNYGGQQFLTSAPTTTSTPTPTVQTGAPIQINEAALVENVKNVVNGYLSENLGAVFEEAIKGTIIEMYAVERIKEVLNENRDLIKSVVVETIKEIQARSKAKAQS